MGLKATLSSFNDQPREVDDEMDQNLRFLATALIGLAMILAVLSVFEIREWLRWYRDSYDDRELDEIDNPGDDKAGHVASSAGLMDNFE